MTMRQKLTKMHVEPVADAVKSVFAELLSVDHEGNQYKKKMKMKKRILKQMKLHWKKFVAMYEKKCEAIVASSWWWLVCWLIWLIWLILVVGCWLI